VAVVAGWVPIRRSIRAWAIGSVAVLLATALWASSSNPSSYWLDTSGRPNDDARAALALLAGAAAEGLDPADYGLRDLDRLTALLETKSPAPPRHRARFDAALSAQMLRYLRDLHIGRVDPRAIGFRLSVPVDQHDFAVLLREALMRHRIADAAADLRPALEQYDALRRMLTRYRAVAAEPAREVLAPAKATRPDQPYGGVLGLYRQLTTLGDLPPDSPPPAEPSLYEGPIVEGVRRFQFRHGLEPDGILGKETMSALQIPMAWRVRQIELALERLRWLPHLKDERLVVINIPMFRLWAWDSIPPDDAPVLGIDVIVGRALSTQTPVFAEEMREVIFRPYWNVPLSILRKEILPMLERDAVYLQRQDMEIVQGAGDDARPVEATPENIERLRQGALRLRQRPGPRNALGLIKFVFPNQENVYMHGTPAQELFNRRRRDFSHGCVRVQDPVALAVWTLKDRPEWDREHILEAMAGGQSLHVKLPRPIQVILFYTTAAVTPEDGTIRFAEDIYRHDARLDRALAARRSIQ
jgi:murein L,D-transpeptidase YcbB/YkuD